MSSASSIIELNEAQTKQTLYMKHSNQENELSDLSTMFKSYKI